MVYREHSGELLKDHSVSLWTAGNAPTQQIRGLTAADILLQLKAQYLLSDTVLAAASFFLESAMTRVATEAYRALFESGGVVYFVNSDIDTFAEHGERKIEKSPRTLTSYNDPGMVARHTTTLASLGHMYRRPAKSISDAMVELWIADVHSREPDTVGAYLVTVIHETRQRVAIQAKLEEVARNRDVDFVWEYLAPQLAAAGFRGEALRIMRSRLAELYVRATAVVLQGATQAPGAAVSEGIQQDAEGFLVAIEGLGLSTAFQRLTAEGVIALKQSWQFQMFKEFYFALARNVRTPPLISQWLPIYRSAALYRAQTGTPPETVLADFRAYCNSISRGTDRFAEPLDVLLKAFEFCTTPLIEAFVDEMCRLAEATAGTTSGVHKPEDQVQHRKHSVLAEGAREGELKAHLLARLSKYAKAPSRSDLDRFLGQFPDELVPGVVTMLDRLDIYDESDIEALFGKFYNDHPELFKGAVLASFAECSGSDAIIKYVVEKCTGLEVQPTLDRALDIVKHTKNRVILIDDCIFSGTQAGQVFMEYLGLAERYSEVQPLSDERRKVLGEAEVLLLTALCTQQGPAAVLGTRTISGRELREHIPGLRVIGTHFVQFTKLFDASSTTFPANVRAKAEEFFREVGYAILEPRSHKWFADAAMAGEAQEASRREKRRRFAVGYGDDQALVAFRYNVPKATVTLLWEKHGSYNGRAWFPILPINEPPWRGD
jgi:hypothetical protein